MKPSTFRTGVILVTGGMILGRVSGLVREVAIASSFGISRGADLAIFAMTLPDLLTNLLIGGAVAAVLIPQYHALVKSHGEVEARRLVGQTLVVLTLLSIAATGILFLMASYWVPVLGPGFAGGDRIAATTLSRIALLAFPLSAATAVITASLQISNRLGAAAMGTLVMNGTIVAVLLGAGGFAGDIRLAAWAVVAGAATRLLVGLICALRGSGLRGMFGFKQSRLLNWSLGWRYLQALAGMGFVVCFPVVARAVSSSNAGELAAVNYAIKLVEVPVGLLSAIVGIVLLPHLSRAAQNYQRAAAGRLLWTATGLMSALMVLVTIVYCLLAGQVVGLLFHHGQVTSSATATVSHLSRVLMVGAPAAVLAALFTAFLHAHKDTRTPLCCSGTALLVLLATSLVVHPRYGASGVLAALAGANGILAILLGARCWWLLYRSESVTQQPLSGAAAAGTGRPIDVMPADAAIASR